MCLLWPKIVTALVIKFGERELLDDLNASLSPVDSCVIQGYNRLRPPNTLDHFGGGTPTKCLSAFSRLLKALVDCNMLFVPND